MINPFIAELIKSNSFTNHYTIMKNSIYIFSLPLFLILFSCGVGRGDEQMVKVDRDDAIILYKDKANEIAKPEVEKMQQPHEKSISADEIPPEISANIKKDEYLSTLDLNSAVIIHNNDQTYYELTFEDDSNKKFAIIFDDRGNKMTI